MPWVKPAPCLRGEESADKPGTAVPLSSSSLPLTKNYVYKEEFCLSALPFKQTFITARAKIASVILSDNIGVVLAKAKGFPPLDT